MTALNITTRKVGGIRFFKIGRLTLSFCVSRSYRPLKSSRAIDRLRDGCLAGPLTWCDRRRRYLTVADVAR